MDPSKQLRSDIENASDENDAKRGGQFRRLRDKLKKGQSIQDAIAAQPSTKKAGRLIVRNLSFDASQKHLTKMFGKIGEVREVHVPLKEEGETKKKRHPGFGFVEFQKVEDAAKAIEALNGKKLCGRAITVENALQKGVYDKSKTSSVPRLKKKLDDEVCDDMAPIDGEEKERMARLLDESADVGKEIKIKGGEKKSESRKKKRKNEGKGEEPPSMGPLEKPKKAKRKIDQLDEAEVVKKKRRKDSDEATKPDAVENVENQENDETQADRVKCGHDLDQGKTVFIRNVPYDAGWKDVKTACEKYGDIDRVYLCRNDDGGHKGSGFIKFKDPSGAQSALKEEASIKEKMRQLGFKDHLTPIDGCGVMVKDRRIIVMEATAPGEAPLRKESKKAERRLQKESWSHLLTMGSITEEKHPAKWAELSKAERRLRKESEKERTFQKNDPNYIVNPLRLSIRNLDLKIDGPALTTAIAAVGFTEEGEWEKIWTKKVTVVRSKDRKDASGIRRSLGYAFAEFYKHEDALATLRYLNSNADAFGVTKRPIIEFAMEDKRKLRIIESRRALVQKRMEETQAET